MPPVVSATFSAAAYRDRPPSEESVVRELEQAYLKGLKVHYVGLQNIHVLGRRFLGEFSDVHRPLDITSSAEYFVVRILRLWMIAVQLADNQLGKRGRRTS